MPNPDGESDTSEGGATPVGPGETGGVTPKLKVEAGAAVSTAGGASTGAGFAMSTWKEAPGSISSGILTSM